MGCFWRWREMVISVVVGFVILGGSSGGNLYEEVSVNWGGPRAQIQNEGLLLTLSLDKISGSGFESYSDYLFGRFDMQMKLPSGNTAGTVTTFYLSSNGSRHDEIDFEFLGNVSGQPYTIHTNIYTQGIGNKEQQFLPWFDPTTAFHTYTILWNPLRIIFMVDNTAIRVFSNHESNGVPFPTSQPMKVYGSIWNGDDWATQGGRIKTDWSTDPRFVATYQNYCVVSWSGNSCNKNSTDQSWQTQGLDDSQRAQMQSIQRNNMINNYCTDQARFPQGFPMECNLTMS